MGWLGQVLFIVLLAITGWLFYRRFSLIRRTILLGRPENLSDQPVRRLGNMVRVALGQKKMFDRPIAGILHLFVYIGFVLINIEVLEIVLDGALGTHRLFAPLGSFYTFLISFFEFLALGVLVACVIFLVRRRIFGVSRLQAKEYREMKGWPALDASLILVFEILLMAAILGMNAADSALQASGNPHYPEAGPFLISHFLAPLFSGWSEPELMLFERATWWFHILGIFGFAIYITYSKHLHILLAFPNTYFARLTPRGEMLNMPEITAEVQSMLGITAEAPTVVPERFGAKDVADLSWKSLLDAYACTECGRCSSACPAHLTGKKLSPRKIMMDTRDRLEDIGRGITANKGELVADQKSLLGDYISNEEILACTTCNACVQECPILINPLNIILQLRRYKVMDEAQAPGSWNMMFQNIETSQAPWKFPANERLDWADSIK